MSHHQDPSTSALTHDTSIVHDVFGTEDTVSNISERDQQIILAQLQNLVMALKTNSKFRSGTHHQKRYQQQQQQSQNSSNNNNSSTRTFTSPHASSAEVHTSVHSPVTPSQADDGGNMMPPAPSPSSSTATTSGPHPQNTLRHSFHASHNQHPLVECALSLRYKLLRPLAGPLSSSVSRSRNLHDEQVLLEPFLRVMASHETTEPISAVAMVAVISFLDLHCDFITATSIARICETARITRGELVDIQSHDAFLARIIQVFVAAFRHPAASHVPEELPVRVFQSIMRIGNEAQSELLRRVSEQGMNDIVSACFTHAINPKNINDRTASRFAPLLRLICKIITCDASIAESLLGIVDDNSRQGSSNNSNNSDRQSSRSPLAVQLQGLVLAHTALLVLRDSIANDCFKSVLYVVRNELTRALLRVGKSSDHIVVLAQVLRTMHLLFSFASVHLVPQLVSFMQFILKRTNVVEGSALLSPQRMDSMQQFDGPNSPRGDSSSSSHSRTLSSSSTSTFSPPSTVAGGKIAPRPRLEEIQVESLWEFCSHEAFPAFLIHHVDLSLENNAIFGGLCWFLAETCVPQNAHLLSHINILPLDCLLVLLNHLSARVSRWSHSSSSASGTTAPVAIQPAPELLKKKHYKQLLEKFVTTLKENSGKAAVKDIFNTWTPDERMAFGFPQETSNLHGVVVGQFLFKHRLRLDPRNLVDFVGDLGKYGDAFPEETDDPKTVAARKQWLLDTEDEVCKFESTRFYHEVRRGFIGSQPFRGKPLLLCLRELCFGFRVSGEAQKIDRIMEEFSVQWFTSNRDAPKDINPFLGKDAPFILSFSIIMLNTDLHIANLPKKMSREDFIRRNRDLDKGQDLPNSFLGAIYDDIKNQQLVFVDMLKNSNSNVNDCDFDFAWSKEVEESALVAAESMKVAGGGKDGAASALSKIISFQTKEDSVLLAYDTFVVNDFWRPCCETFLKILHIGAVSLPTVSSINQTQHANHSYHSLRETLALIEHHQHQNPTANNNNIPSIELLESVNRGLQALALTGHRMSLHDIPDFIVNCLLDFVSIDLSSPFEQHQPSPFEQIVELGNKVSPLLSLDTLFRGFLVDVADSLSPESFMRLARCLVTLLLCGAFDTRQNHHHGSNRMSDLLLKPTTIAAPPSSSLDPNDLANKRAREVQLKQQQQKSSGGWFSGFFSSSSGNDLSEAGGHHQHNNKGQQNNTSSSSSETQERINNGGYSNEELTATLRLRSALPSLRELFQAIDNFSLDAIRSLLSSLVAVIDEGSLVAPQWKDELVSVGAAFVVEVLIQCPSLMNTNKNNKSSSSNANANEQHHSPSQRGSGIETLVRSFLEEQLESASKTASSNIVKSILRYAQYYEHYVVGVSSSNNKNPLQQPEYYSTASRVLKLVSCVQCLSPSAFSPIVKEILTCIDRQLQDPVSSARGIEEVVWCAILRILKLAGRVTPPQSNNSNQQSSAEEQQQNSDDPQQQQSSSTSYYQPKYHALSILGRIVRSGVVPLSLSTELAETTVSFALLDIPLARTPLSPASSLSPGASLSTSTSLPLFAPPPPQQHQNSSNNNNTAAAPIQQQHSSSTYTATSNSPPTSPSARTNVGGGSLSSSVSRQNSFTAPVRDDDLPIPILSSIHERLVSHFSQQNQNNSNNHNNSLNAHTHTVSFDEAVNYWLKFIVAITMGLVAAAEHASNHSAMELQNALSVLVTSTPTDVLPPNKAVQLLENVLLPVVDRVFNGGSDQQFQQQLQQQQEEETQQDGSSRLPPPEEDVLDLDATKKRNQQQQSSSKRELSMFSPTDLLTYMLGPLAGPDSRQNQQQRSSHQNQHQNNNNVNSSQHSTQRNHRCSDEVKNGVLRLVASTTLHYFDILAASQKQFLPLWNRVLASYYAIYTRQHPAAESDDVREVIQYTVWNIVSVPVAMAREDNNSSNNDNRKSSSSSSSSAAAIFAMHPLFWKQTREMLRRFDFGQQMDQQLESMGYA